MCKSPMCIHNRMPAFVNSSASHQAIDTGTSASIMVYIYIRRATVSIEHASYQKMRSTPRLLWLFVPERERETDIEMRRDMGTEKGKGEQVHEP